MRSEAELFEKCLSELESGSSLEDVLNAHPRARGELERLLRLASQTTQEQARDPSPSVVHRSRTKLLARAVELRTARTHRGFSKWVPRYAVGFAAMLAALILSGYGLFSVSAQSLPGDFLYPIKRSAETLRLEITSNEQRRERLEEQFEKRRTHEVMRLLAGERVEYISFEGIVEQMRGKDWIVSGINVLIDEQTKVIGEINVSDGIEVEGETRPGEYVFAFELHKRTMRFQGTVDRLNADTWIIDGRSIAITASSEIEGDISVGNIVDVLVAVGDDQSLTLLEAHLLDDEMESPPENRQGEGEGEKFEFTGVVDSIGTNYWVVDGRQVRVDSDTDIEDDISVGDLVRVQAEQRGDVDWALHIDRIDDGGNGSHEGEAEETHEPDDGDDPPEEESEHGDDEMEDDEVDEEDEEESEVNNPEHDEESEELESN
jgi:hypothetical protein